VIFLSEERTSSKKLVETLDKQTCPFSYETCIKYGHLCRETFERNGDASGNDCYVAEKWQTFRNSLFLPRWKKRQIRNKKKESAKLE
jgi:hypothetical protein